MSVQVVVSGPGVGTIYVWDENHPWQGWFAAGGDGGWSAGFEHKDIDNLDLPLGLAAHDLGHFSTLPEAIQAHLAHPWKVPGVQATVAGDLVLG